MLERMLGPERGRHEAVCQQGRWVSKGSGLGVPHRLEKRMSASEDAWALETG